MRINVSVLMEKAKEAYQSFATTRHDAETAYRTNAQVILPSAAVLRESEDDDPAAYAVDMDPGMGLAIWRSEDGATRATVIVPEADEAPDAEEDGDGMEPVLYTLRNTRNIEGDVERAEQDGNIPLIAEGGNNAAIMLRLHSWLHSDRAHEVIEEDLRRGLIGTLRVFVGDIGERTQSRSFDQTGLMMNVLENLRDAPVPEGLDRYLEARMLRERIRVLDPANADAGRASPEGMNGVLGERGVTARADAGVTVRAPTGPMLVDDNMLRQAVRTNGALCRQVFRPLTKTAIEDLAVGILEREEYDTVIQAFRDRDEVLSGPRVDKAVEKLGTVIQDSVGERYQYEVSLASADERDVILVREPGYGMHYFYSWETVDRRPLLEMDGGEGIPTISPEEVPDTDELERLRGACAAVEDRYWAQRAEAAEAERLEP